MDFPQDLKYTKSHEWARKEGNKITVGITEYAQKEISDVVFVELPSVGQSVAKEKAVAVVESVKAAFDIYAPVSGKITSVNTNLESDPALVNKESYQSGWFFEIEAADEGEWNSLMSADDYSQLIKQGA